LGPIEIPHPTGVVIGRGTTVGRNVRIFQNVTLGSSRRGDYPTIGDDVTIYAGAVISGDITIGSGSIIGANAVVTTDVPPNKTIRARDAI
jgi:serine O-acetyltransferase